VGRIKKDSLSPVPNLCPTSTSPTFQAMAWLPPCQPADSIMQLSLRPPCGRENRAVGPWAGASAGTSGGEAAGPSWSDDGSASEGLGPGDWGGQGTYIWVSLEMGWSRFS